MNRNQEKYEVLKGTLRCRTRFAERLRHQIEKKSTLVGQMAGTGLSVMEKVVGESGRDRSAA